MSVDSKNLPSEDLALLTSQHLDELLRTELEKDDKDSEKILQILRILEEREAIDPANNVEVASLWKAYQENLQKDALLLNTARKDRKTRRWIGRVAAVAAIVCILIAAAPKAMGAENIFEVLGRWTKTIFEFFDPSNATEPPEEYVFKTDHPGLQQIYDAVAEQGVTIPVVPTWVPEGFVLDEVKFMPIRGGKKVCAALSSDEGYITIAIEIYNEKRTNQYTKDDAGVEQYELAGVKHYLMPNEGSWQVVWVVDNIESVIRTNCEEEIVYSILTSIYTEAD